MGLNKVSPISPKNIYDITGWLIFSIKQGKYGILIPKMGDPSFKHFINYNCIFSSLAHEIPNGARLSSEY